MRRSIIILASCAVTAVVLWRVFATGADKSQPATIMAGERFVYPDGKPGFIFHMTNHTEEALQIERVQNDIAMLRAGLKPMSAAGLPTSPPQKGSFVELRYRRPPGPLEAKLRLLGARLRLCAESPEFRLAQTIKVEN